MIFKLSLRSIEKSTRQRALCRVSKIKHSAKSFFAECFLLPRVFCVALGKELLCRVPKKYSAKYLVLGKEPNSGSSRYHDTWARPARHDSLAVPNTGRADPFGHLYLACALMYEANTLSPRGPFTHGSFLFTSREIYPSFGGLLMLPRYVLPLFLASSLIRDSFHSC
jgi:hypothetical protein